MIAGRPVIAPDPELGGSLVPRCPDGQTKRVTPRRDGTTWVQVGVSVEGEGHEQMFPGYLIHAFAVFLYADKYSRGNKRSPSDARRIPRCY